MRYNLELSSTPSCNMACTYCFEGDELKSKQKQTTQNAEFIIDKVYQMLNSEEFSKEYDGITINFWGGEPTLTYEWNKQIIEATRNFKNKSGGDVKYFFYTNGFNLKNVTKHIDLFDLNDPVEQDQISMQISWDGETTKNLRVDHGSKPTYIKVKENVLALHKDYPNLNLGIKATINPIDLLKLESIWKNFYSFRQEARALNKNANITFSPTLNYYDDFDTSPDFLAKIKIEFLKIARLEQLLVSQFTENGNDARQYNDVLFTWFKPSGKHYTTGLDQGLKRLTNCSAGINIE